MKPTESASAFSTFALLGGVSISDCSPRQGFDQMFSFFQSVSPEGCEDSNGDMLLFQWGTHDWGSGDHFELNITRQFIEQEFEDDGAISQLSLTFKFKPTPALQGLGSGSRWCSGLTEVEKVRAFVFSSEAFCAVAENKALAVGLMYCYV